MTRDEFKALRPEFSATSYDARIDALLANIEQIDEEKTVEVGLSVNMVLSAWLAARLARQDFAIQYGAGASLGSSSTVEKKVGDVSVKRSTSNSSSSSSTSKSGRNPLSYQDEYDGYLRQIGMGAIAVGTADAPVIA